MPVLTYRLKAKTYVLLLLLLSTRLFAQESSNEIEYIFPKNFEVLENLTHLLQWKSPNDGQPDIIYKVYHWEAIKEGLTRRESLSTNGTFLIKNLKPNTTYLWQIVEHNIKDSTQIKGPVFQYRTTYKAKKNLSSKDLQIYYVEDFNRAYISEIDAQFSRLGDTIYIRGDYFGQDSDQAKVMLNDNPLEIVDYFHNFIAARVPDTLRYNLRLQLNDRTVKSPYTPYLMRRKSNIYINSLRTDFDDIDEIDFNQIDGYSHWFERQVIDTLNSLWSDFLSNRMRDSLRTMSDFISDTTILIPTDSLSSIFAPIALINGRLEEMWRKLLQEKISDTLRVILGNYKDRRLGISLESTKESSRGLEVEQMEVQLALDSIWQDMLSGKVEDSVLKANEAYFKRTAVVSENNDTIAQILLPSLEINQALSRMWRDVFSEKLKDTLLQIQRSYQYDSIGVAKNRLGIQNLLLSEEYVDKKIDEQIALGNITTSCDCSQIDSLKQLGLNDLFSVGDITPLTALYAKNKEAMNMDTINLLLGGYLERYYKRKEAQLKAERAEKARLAAEEKRVEDSLLQVEIDRAQAEMLAKIEQQRIEDSLLAVRAKMFKDSVAFAALQDSIRIADSTRLARIEDSIKLQNFLADLGDTLDINQLTAAGIDPLTASILAGDIVNFNTLKFKINRVFEENQLSMFSRTLYGNMQRFDGESLGTDATFGYLYGLKALPQYSRLTDNSGAYEGYDLHFSGINIYSDILGINPIGAVHSFAYNTQLQLQKRIHFAGGNNREHGRLNLVYDSPLKTLYWTLNSMQETAIQLDKTLSALSKTTIDYVQKLNHSTALRLSGQLSRTTLRSPEEFSDQTITHNVYGDERIQDLSAQGINQLIRRDGFDESIFNPPLNPLNWSLNGELTTRFGFKEKSPTLGYNFLLANSRTNLQSESRSRIDNYLLHAHRIGFNSTELKVSTQFKSEQISNWTEYHQLANNLLNEWKPNENWYQDFSLAFNGKLTQGDNSRLFAGIAPIAQDVNSAISFANNLLLNNNRLNQEQIDTLEAITGKPWFRDDKLKFKPESQQFNQLFNQITSEIGFDKAQKVSNHNDLTLEADYRLPQQLWLDEWRVQLFVNQKSISTQGSYLMDNGQSINYTDAYLNNLMIYELPWANNLFLRTNLNGEFNSNFGLFGSVNLGISWSSKVAEPSVIILDKEDQLQNNPLFGNTNTPEVQPTEKPAHHGLMVDYSFRRRNPDIRAQYLASNLGYASILGGLESALNTYQDQTLFSKDPLSFTHLKNNSYLLDFNNNPIQTEQGFSPWTYTPLSPELIHSLQLEYQFHSPANQLSVNSGFHTTLIQQYIAPQRIGTTIDEDPKSLETDRYKTYLIYQNTDQNILQIGISSEAKYDINEFFGLEGNLTYNLWTGNQQPINLPGLNGYISFGAYEIEPDLDIITKLHYVGPYLHQSLWYNTSMPDRYLMDFEILYFIRPIKTQLKVGAENVFNNSYQISGGTGIVGGYYYMNLRYTF